MLQIFFWFDSLMNIGDINDIEFPFQAKRIKIKK